MMACQRHTAHLCRMQQKTAWSRMALPVWGRCQAAWRPQWCLTAVCLKPTPGLVWEPAGHDQFGAWPGTDCFTCSGPVQLCNGILTDFVRLNERALGMKHQHMRPITFWQQQAGTCLAALLPPAVSVFCAAAASSALLGTPCANQCVS